MTRAVNGRGGPQIIPRPDNVEPGGPPPWNHLGQDERRVDLDRLLHRVAAYEPQFRPGLPSSGRSSAVLIPLYLDGAEPTVILTRRSPAMRAHTHEVSFPGGRHDDTDIDHRDTALREAHEEIHLPREDVQIVGQLDSFVTGGSKSLVHPFVGKLEHAPTALQANPDEVEAILHLPLTELLLDEVWREERWQRDGTMMPVTFFELYGDTVWGATGNMLRQLLTLATDPS